MADIHWGESLGNALAQGAHARYFTQKTQLEADQDKRQNDAQQYVEPAMQGDQTAFAKLAAAYPQAGVAVATGLARMDASKLAHVKGAADFAATSANAVLQANPTERPDIYKRMIADGQARGYDMGRLPPDYSPAIDAQLRYHRAQAVPIKTWFEENEKNQRKAATGAGNGEGALLPLPGQPPAAGAPAGRPAPAMSVPANGPRADAGPIAPPVNALAQNAPPVDPQAGPPNALAPPPQVAAAPVAPPPVMAQAQPVAPPPAAAVPAAPVAGPVIAQGDGGPASSPGAAPGVAGPVAMPPGTPAEPAAPGAAPAGRNLPPMPTGTIWNVNPEMYGASARLLGPTKQMPFPHPAVAAGGEQMYTLPDGRHVFYKPSGDAKDLSPAMMANPAFAKMYGDLADNERVGLDLAMRTGDGKGVQNYLKQMKNGIPADFQDVHGDDFKESPYFKTLPFTDRNTVSGLLDGSIPAASLSKRGGGGQGGVGGLPVNTLFGIAKQIDPAWSPNEGAQRQRFEASLVGNGQNAQNVTAINVVPRHAADLVKITDAMNQNKPQLVNDIVLKMKQQFGDTAVPDMTAARNLAALEFLKAAVGPGSLNAPLEKAFMDSIPIGATADQVRQVVNGYVDKVLDRAHVLQETADQYHIENKNMIMHPETKGYIDYLKGSANFPGGGPAPKQAGPSIWDTATKFFDATTARKPVGPAASPGARQPITDFQK